MLGLGGLVLGGAPLFAQVRAAFWADDERDEGLGTAELDHGVEEHRHVATVDAVAYLGARDAEGEIAVVQLEDTDLLERRVPDGLGNLGP